MSALHRFETHEAVGNPVSWSVPVVTVVAVFLLLLLTAGISSAGELPDTSQGVAPEEAMPAQSVDQTGDEDVPSTPESRPSQEMYSPDADGWIPYVPPPVVRSA